MMGREQRQGEQQDFGLSNKSNELWKSQGYVQFKRDTHDQGATQDSTAV